MDSCACAWERTKTGITLGQQLLSKTYDWHQTHWCRAHMEAEIAKQAHAGSTPTPDTTNPAGVDAGGKGSEGTA